MFAALKTAFGTVVSTHALDQRLRAECAARDEMGAAFSSRTLAEEIILDELSKALEMTPEARRIFMHPGREKVLGLIKPTVHFDRSGRRVQSTKYRRNESGYYWSGDVVYVLDHNTVVTCIIPDANQVETLYRVMPEAECLNVPLRSIVKATREAATFEEPVSQVYVHQVEYQKPPQRIHFKREAPPTAKWLGKEGAAWLVLVVDDVDESSELIRRAMARIREETVGTGLAVHVEETDCQAVKAIQKKLGLAKDFRIKDLPAMPAVDWSKCRNEDPEDSSPIPIPNAARKWWIEMLEAGQPQGKLVCVVTPEKARSILEIAAGSSNAAWRKDREATKPGHMLTIKCMSIATSVERSTF